MYDKYMLRMKKIHLRQLSQPGCFKRQLHSTWPCILNGLQKNGSPEFSQQTMLLWHHFVHPKKCPGQTWLVMDDYNESQPLNAKYGESSNNSSIHN